MQNTDTDTATQKKYTVDTAALLRFGFSIFPLHSWDMPKDEPEVGKRGKRPVIGSWEPYKTHRATDAEVSQWTRCYPGCNWAIITGHISGIVVLDIDDPDTARAWIESNGGLPETPCVRTGKGEHHYFRMPTDGIRNTVRLHGCDIRGEGGYVVAPGSIHGTGVLYEWIVSPDDTELAPFPAWIISALEKKPEKKPAPRTAPPPMIGGTPYGRAAMQGECDKIRSTAEGGRNHQLNVSSFSLGQLIAGGELSHYEAEAALLDAARACGLPDTEARKTMKSGLESGMNDPRTAPEKPTPTNGGTIERKETVFSLFPFTDTGNAERFAERNKGRALYDHTSKAWLVWDAGRWTRDNSGTAQRLAKETARAIDDELKHVTEETRDTVRKHASYSEKALGRRAMLLLAQSELPTNQGELDSHPMLLNLDNGTLNLETLEFGPHKPENKLTKISPVRYDPAATCPMWVVFLNRIFEGNAETIQFVQQMAGYVLTADTREQCFFVLYGTGANGKSTLLNTLLHIMGDYGTSADFDTFIMRDGGGQRYDLAEFTDARLVAASEGERGKKLAEAMVKQITGGEKITCSRKYGHPFSYIPKFKLLLSTNHRPRITGTDHAIRRRVKLIPFNVTISDDEKDAMLLSKLKSESSGILNWMLQGLESWKEKGLIQAESVKSATSEYLEGQDILAPFIAEKCVTGDTTKTTLKALYEAYTTWTTEAGEQTIAKRIFSERLTERGFRVKTGAGNVLFVHGIGIREIVS